MSPANKLCLKAKGSAPQLIKRLLAETVVQVRPRLGRQIGARLRAKPSARARRFRASDRLLAFLDGL